MFTPRDLMMKLQLQRLIPEQHVVIVERDGLADRLEGPGYVKINPLTERFGPVVEFSFLRLAELQLVDARSAEGDIFELQLTIEGGFNPRRCNVQKMPGLVRNAPAVQEAILRTNAPQIAHKVIGGYSSSQLLSGGIRGEIEQGVKSQLRRAVLFAGIELYNVIVERLTPPVALQAARSQQIRLEIAAQERTKLAEIEALESGVRAKAAALETEVRAKAEALATQLLGEAGVKGREALYNLLAGLDPELVKQITDAEVLSQLANNGGSVNLVTPMTTQLNPLLQALLMQQAVSNSYPVANGKENGAH